MRFDQKSIVYEENILYLFTHAAGPMPTDRLPQNIIKSISFTSIQMSFKESKDICSLHFNCLLFDIYWAINCPRKWEILPCRYFNWYDSLTFVRNFARIFHTVLSSSIKPTTSENSDFIEFLISFRFSTIHK